MTTNSTEDWVKYAAEQEAAKIARERELFLTEEQYARDKFLMLENYTAEDKKARSIVGRFTSRKSDTEIAAERASEAVALETAHKDSVRQINEKYPQPTFKEWLVLRDVQAVRQTYGNQNQISNGEENPQPQPANNSAKSLLDFEYRRGSRATKDENSIHYHPKGDKTNIAFTDTGKQIEIYKWEESESLLASMQLASQKWAKLKIDGDDAYKAECVRIAVEHGFKISNPELQDAIRLGIEEKERLAAARAFEMKTDQAKFGVNNDLPIVTAEPVQAGPIEQPAVALLSTANLLAASDRKREFHQALQVREAIQSLGYGFKEVLETTKEMAWIQANDPTNKAVITELLGTPLIQKTLSHTTTSADLNIGLAHLTEQYASLKHLNLGKEEVFAMDLDTLHETVVKANQQATTPAPQIPSEPEPMVESSNEIPMHVAEPVPTYSEEEVNRMMVNVDVEAEEQRVIIDYENDIAHNAIETAATKSLASTDNALRKDAVIEVAHDTQQDTRASKSEKTTDVNAEQKQAKATIVKWTSQVPKGQHMAVEPFSDDPNHNKPQAHAPAEPAPTSKNNAQNEHKHKR